MDKISIQELVAVNSTPKAKALIVRYGYEPAIDYDDLLYKLLLFTKEHKEDALKELAEIHPDKELILNYFDKPSKCDCSNKVRNILSRISNVKKSENFDTSYLNADGNRFNNQNQMSKNIAILVGLGIFTIFLSAMSKAK